MLTVARVAGQYEVRGRLRRGEAYLELSEAFITDCIVLWKDELAPLARDGGWPFLVLMRATRIRVPLSDGEDFVRGLAASVLLPTAELPPELAIEVRSPSPQPVLRVERAYGGQFAGKISFLYEGIEIDADTQGSNLYDEGSRTAIVRDRSLEQSLVLDVMALGFSTSYGYRASITSARLWPALRRLIADGWRVEGSEGTFRSGGELSMSISSGIDWFDLNVAAQFGDATASLPDLLQALHEKESFVRLDDGSLGLIDEAWHQRLEPFVSSALKQKGALRFRASQATLLDALLAAREDVSFDEVFRKARERITSLQPRPQQPSSGFRGTLRDYQKDGLGWLTFLADAGFGGCLADDMGLGKTVQVLAFLQAKREGASHDARPSLVVAPRSVIFNWQNEAERFTPALRVLEHASADRSRDAEVFTDYDIILTTYGTLRRDAALLASIEFDTVVLDEAQAIKNPSSQSAKAARLLRSRQRLALTGTPVENHIGDLWSIFEFLNPGMLGGSAKRIPSWLKIAGTRGDEGMAARALVGRALRPFILRWTKGEVARELPDRVEQTILCELDTAQRAIYDDLRNHYRASLLGHVAAEGMNKSRMHLLEALLRLRQAACHPGLVNARYREASSAKLDTLLSELSVLLDENHKVLVFSQFTSFLALVKAQLDERGVVYEYLDGKTKNRAERVQRFQEDPTVSLFLISLKAGGLGLNLTAAEYVFLLDPWWNPAVEAQAIDRSHRIGQTRTVMAYRLVARDTIEENILQLQDDKRALASAILTEENSVLRQLSAEDLDLLLS